MTNTGLLNEDEIMYTKLSDAVFERIASTSYEHKLDENVFGRVALDGEVEGVTILRGRPYKGGGHRVVCTFGAGSLDTGSVLNEDGVVYDHRAEFFYVQGGELSSTVSVGEDLASLVFSISEHGRAIEAGTIVEGVASGMHKRFLITENPLGVFSNLRLGVVKVAPHYVSFLAVTEIFGDDEYELLVGDPDGVDELHMFLTSLGGEAYSPNRQTWSKIL